MALKQVEALAALRDAVGEVIEASLCEIQGNWLALVNTDDGRRLAWVTQEESSINNLWKDIEKSVEIKKLHIYVMKLNANNAAIVRRYVKWSAPSACGVKGTSVGFSDWLGKADAAVADLFAKRQLKPVFVDFTSEDSQALQRNFLEAVDTVTWGVLEQGYKEGYGANAAGLKTEEDIVKALLYGYSMIGLDCSEKVNLSIEKLSDAEVNKRFGQFNDAFRAALHASYLNAEFKVGDDKITFTENQLHRIVLEYGEAIMHVQFIYNSYLKNTPWDIDFELSLSKPGKVLTPQEHYLLANELQRNNIKLSAVCFDALKDQQALTDNLKLHCEIADTFGYRLSFANADIALADPAAAMKYLKGKVYFKLNNILWMSAVKLMASLDSELYKKLCDAVGCEAVAENQICHSNACNIFAQSYRKILNPAEKNNFTEEFKAFVDLHHEDYVKEVLSNVANFLKNI